MVEQPKFSFDIFEKSTTGFATQLMVTEDIRDELNN